MIVRRINTYKPSSEGLYKPTRVQKIKKSFKSGIQRIDDILEKDRQAYREQRVIDKREHQEFVDKIKFKRKHYTDQEKKTLSSFRKKSARKLLRRFRL